MRIGVTACLISAAVFAAQLSLAHATTISSTQLQSNFNGGTGAGESAPIAASAFDFSAQMQLINIQSISITLTMIDGDTGLGPNGTNNTPYPPDGNAHGDDDFDVNSLSLVLDGINLGQDLLLNGFDAFEDPFGPDDFISLTISGTPDNANALLTALQDGFLVATVLDATGVSLSNGFRIPDTGFNGGTSIFATLSITGDPVPEPSTLTLAACGTVLLLSLWRRKKSNRGLR